MFAPAISGVLVEEFKASSPITYCVAVVPGLIMNGVLAGTAT